MLAAVPGRLRSFEAAFLGTLFVLLTALAFFFPYSGDDWAWGSEVGTERLHDWFRDYNGRYAGNLAVLVLTRLPKLNHLVIAGTLCLTLFLVQHLTSNRTRSGYLLSALLLLAMPLPMWRQSVVWTSGFTNYALVMPLVLLFLVALRDDWSGRPGPGRRVQGALALAGLASCLFMEHVTTYLVAASLTHLVVFFWVHRALPARGIGWCAGILVGAVVMFSNGAYRAVANGTSYKHLVSSDDAADQGTFSQLVRSVARLAVVDNAFLNWVLVLLVVLLAVQVRPAAWRTRAVVGVAAAFLVVVSVTSHAFRYQALAEAWGGLPGVAGLLLLALVLVAAHVLVQDRSGAWQLAATALSVLVLVLPLASVQPIGPRCFYPSYVLLLCVPSLLLRELSSRVGLGTTERLAPVLGTLAAVPLALQFVTYVDISQAAHDRLFEVRRAARHDAPRVTVYQLPYGAYVHDGDPSSPVLQERFKLFYHLPQSLEIRVIRRPPPVVPTPSPTPSPSPTASPTPNG